MPPSVVGSGMDGAESGEPARPAPNTAAISSTANAVPVKENPFDAVTNASVADVLPPNAPSPAYTAWRLCPTGSGAASASVALPPDKAADPSVAPALRSRNSTAPVGV